MTAAVPTLATSSPDLEQRLPNRADVRLRVSAHLAEKRAVEELGIAPNRPADLHDFAFVGIAPKRSSQSEWYRCSFCETDRKFSSGRIVLSSDNLLRLIGDECWQKHLDRNRYEEEKQDYRNYERRQRFEQLRERLRPKLDATITKLHTVITNNEDTFLFVENLPDLIASGAPVLLEQFQQARRVGGQLRVERSVIDYAAMERDGRQRSVLRTEVIHTILGLNAIFKPSPQPQNELQSALNNILSARNLIVRTEWESVNNAQADKAISTIESNIRDGISAAERSREAVNNAAAFCSQRNVAGLVLWSDDTDSELMFYGRITSTKDGFSFTPENGQKFSLRRPETLNTNLVPDLSELRDFI